MSTLTVENISDGTDTVGTEYLVNGSAKAWVTYDQTVPAVDDSLNISSVTDSATGLYGVNFSNNFSNIDYCATGSADLIPGSFTAGAFVGIRATKTTSSSPMATDNLSAIAQDRRNNIQWVGNLA